ncbi:MAG: hypothetical protein ABS938_19110 [Psychrobacillus psychrodurans]
MSMRIIFRNPSSGGVNTFRQKVRRLSSLPGEILVLGYGYFGDDTGLDMGLLSAINHGFTYKNNQVPTIILVGGNFSKCTNYFRSKSCSKPTKCHCCAYEKFYQDLKSKCKWKVVRLFHWKLPSTSKTWHAKIAFKLKYSKNKGKYIPIAALTGSSNLTRSAFGVSPTRYSSHECNFYIEANKHLKRLGKTTIVQIEQHLKELEEESFMDHQKQQDFKEIFDSLSFPVRAVGWKEEDLLNTIKTEIENLVGPLENCVTHSY